MEGDFQRATPDAYAVLKRPAWKLRLLTAVSYVNEHLLNSLGTLY